MIELIDSLPLQERITLVSILMSGILAISVVWGYAWHLSETRNKRRFERERKAAQERVKINPTWERFSGPGWRS